MSNQTRALNNRDSEPGIVADNAAVTMGEGDENSALGNGTGGGNWVITRKGQPESAKKRPCKVIER